MIKIWFLISLMSYPGMPAIAYKGFGGYLEKDECEEKRIVAENNLSNFEMQRGNTVYIKTFCLEMDAFDISLKVPKKSGEEMGAKLQLQEINYDGYTTGSDKRFSISQRK
jgi:hypothetical protein